MTKFEQIGVNYLYGATNTKEANRTFARSCNICCNKGIHLSCDKCTIEQTHRLIVALFSGKEVGGNDQK